MNLKSSLKKKFGRVPHYISIATIVAGTSITSINTANADNIGAALTWNDETGAAVFDQNSGTLTIIAPATNEGVEKVTGITAGVGITAGNVVVRDNAADINTAISGSAVMNDFTADVDDNQTGDALDFDLGDATADVIAIAGDVVISNADTGNSTNLVTSKGVLTVAGTTTISAVGGDGTTTTAILDIDDEATFTGAVTLNDGGTSEDGVSKVTLTANAADTITFTGGLAAAADGEGELEIDAGASTLKTVSGTIGTTAVRLKVLDINTTATFDSAVFADAITIDAAGGVTFDAEVGGTTMAIDTANADIILKGDATVAISQSTTTNIIKFAGTGDQTLTGAVTSITDADGTLNNANTGGTVTVASAVGTDAARLAVVDSDASSTTVFSGAIHSDLVTLDGTITLSTNENDTLDINWGAASKMIIAKTVTNTQNVLDDVATAFSVSAGAKLYAPINLKGGQALILMDGANGAADDATAIAALNTAAVDNILIDYTVTADAGNDEADLNATYKSVATTASEASITNNQAIALKQAYLSAIDDTTTDNAVEEAFEKALTNSGATQTALEDTKLAQQVAPQTDLISGSSVAAQGVTGSVQGVMSNRMASLRSGDAYFGTGVAAGGMSAQSGFIQVFGSTVDQDSKKVGSGTQAGYDSDSQGVAIGFDGVTDNGMTIGVSLATANTDVDGKGVGKAKNSIDTYSASLYMDTSTDNGYFEGSLTFGVNENSTSRKVNTAGLNRTYTGSYDSNQISLNLGVGVPSEVGAGYLTPFGSFTATVMDTDAYTEKSTVANDALRLKVAQDDISSMVGTVGLKFHGEMSNGGVPMISLAINNEFGDNTINSTNTFQNGGTAFKTSTAVEELSATLGLGYSYGTDATSIEFAYEADANDDDYLSHYGSIKIVGKF
ncbi:autotransporter outer membrane beta-barrel domain-containing protein [Candidatus Pelagibacter ubique]|uniref:autotransporter family protein n=1 Tax=Pelagibacter ubique TaxID=198252 RepID=UPI0003C7F9C3